MKKCVNLIACMCILVLILCFVAACGTNKDTDTASKENAASETASAESVTSDESEASGTESTGSTDSTDSTQSSNETSSGTASSEFPDNSPTVYLKSALNGDTVTVTAAVKNNVGLSGFSIKIAYDKNVVTASGFDDVKKLGLASNLMQSAANCDGTVTAVYASAAGFKENGDIFSITFKLNDKNAASTEFKIISDKNSFVDLAVQYADYKTQNVTLKLK